LQESRSNALVSVWFPDPKTVNVRFLSAIPRVIALFPNLNEELPDNANPWNLGDPQHCFTTFSPVISVCK
jgi:hypothetical protein